MIIENKNLYYLIAAVAALLIIFSWVGFQGAEFLALPDDVSAATSSQVTVSASVSTAISCATDQTSTSFGTLTDSAISTSTPNASTTMSCGNSSAGCTLSINDLGSSGSSTVRAGLYNSTSTALIESPNGSFSASTTLSAGTEGYGIRATTTSAGSGGTLSINLRYNTGAAQGLLGSINDVGGLSTTTITLASSTSAVTNREIVVTHKAAIATVTPGGTYNDTITYSCTAN